MLAGIPPIFVNPPDMNAVRGLGTRRSSSPRESSGPRHSVAGSVSLRLSTYNSKGMIDTSAGTPPPPMFADGPMRGPIIEDNPIRFSKIDMSV